MTSHLNVTPAGTPSTAGTPLRRWTGGLLAAGLLAGGSVVLLPAAAEAAVTTFAVTTTADIATTDGACGDSSITTAPSPLSLREATCLARNIGGPVTITIGFGTYTLVNGELAVGTAPGDNVTINGASVSGSVIDGGGSSRVLTIDPDSVGGVTASIAGLTIKGGSDDTFGGAGILAGSGTAATPDSLSLAYVTITDNHTGVSNPAATNQPGGGVQMYGGALSVTNSTFSNNSSGNSPGSALDYFATGGAGQQLSVSGSTFRQNSSVASAGVSNGGAVALQGQDGTSNVASSQFIDNSVSGSGSGRPVGAGIWSESGALTVTGSTFTGNTVSGGTGAVGGGISAATSSLTAHYNRFVGNSAPAGSALNAAAASPVQGNWYGCNAGPNNPGCDTIDGSPTASPRLVLTTSATPASVTGPNATSTVAAGFTRDSNGAVLPTSQLSAFAGLPVSWSNPLPSGATVSPGSSTISNGSASTTYNSQNAVGSGGVTASIDGASATASIAVNQAPSITSANSASFNVGQSGSFTVTTTGYPSPALTQTGTLPSGLTFTDNGDGTATLSGTPTGGGGTFPLNLTANNGVSPNATQTLTVTVGQPPAFSSTPSTITFTRGTNGSYTFGTSGVPRVGTITESGTMPAGLYFHDFGDGTAQFSGNPSASGSFPVTVTATNGVAPNATWNVTIQVNQAPAVTTNPNDQTVQPGASVTFTAAASGVPTPTTQWQRSTDGGASFSNIAGATSTSYTHTAIAGENGNQYRAVFTNSVSSATSTAATLNVGTAPAFTSADTTDFLVGSAGSFPITTSGIPSATLTRTGAQFPAWLALTDNGDGTGTLTGAPPVGSGGTYPFTLKAANGFSPSASQTFTLTVGEPPAITSADHATFGVGSPGSFTVTTTAGFPAATALQLTGGLPAGVSFTDNGDGTGSLSGTPAAGSGGSYPMTVHAGNTKSPEVTQSFTLQVNEPPAITSADHATFSAGSAGTFTVTTGPGYPTATTLTKAGTLPSGVTFTDNGDGTATIAGTPASGSRGVYPLTLTASNGSAPDATQTFTLTVDEAPTVTTQPSDATVAPGSTATFSAAASGYPAPTVQWQKSTDGGANFLDVVGATSPSLTVPAALTDSGSRFRAVFTNTVGPATTTAATLTVGVAPAITSASSTTMTVGSAGSFTVTSTGTPTPQVGATGQIPAGLSFVDQGDGTAKLSGTPAAGTAGTYPIHVSATNGIGSPADQTLTLTVAPVPLLVTTSSLPDGQAGTPYSATLAASGGTGPYSWSLIDGTTLPAGLTLSTSGVISGTPQTSGTRSVTVQATDAATPAQTAHRALSVLVAPAPVTVPGAPTVGTASAGDGAATVSFTPPSSTGGSPITGYTVTASPGGRTATGTASPITVTGLTNGTSYTFSVRATNASGPGAASAASNAVTPAATPISVKYAQLGGAGSVLGNPTGPEYAVAGGSARTYQNGNIYYSRSTGAREVHGRILEHYKVLGGPTGELGFPTTDESLTQRRDGRYNHFAGAGGASIFWSNATGAWSLHGAIRDKWIALGAEHGILGYPTTDESLTRQHDGRYNHFAGSDTASIFWSPATGAWSVHGAIRTKWIATGAESGRLGYPVSDEFAVTGGRRSTFAHGWIVWRPNGQITVTYK